MPGKHTAKQKRQAKHIIASYKKRGVPAEKAKHIAWATVNKEKHESSAWMFNGAGDPVYIGPQGSVSQFNPSGQVSPGTPYLPDEVAKMLVKESGLRKSDTISKRVIVGYLESMGLSAGWAVDVAKVLRDVYGVTPTFDESSLYAVSGGLVEELTGVLNESFPMPFLVDDEPRLLSEVDLVGSFLETEFMESTDEDYDVALAHLAMIPADQFMDVVRFHEWVGTDVFNYIESVAVDGPDGMAEQIVDGLCFPFRVESMDQAVQDVFAEDIWPMLEDAHDDMKSKALVTMHGITPEKHAAYKAKTAPSPEHKAFGKKVKADWAKSDQQAKQQAGKAAKAARGAERKAAAAKEMPSLKVQLRKHGHDQPSPEDVAKKAQSDRAQKLSALKKDKGPSHESPSQMSKAGHTAVGVMKKVGRAGVTAAAHVAHAAGDVGGAFAHGIKKGWDRFNADVDKKVANIHAHGSTAEPKPGSEGARIKKSRALAQATASYRKRQGEKKPGLLRRSLGAIARAAQKFSGHLKDKAKEAMPGVASHLPGGSEHAKGEGEPKKKQVAPKIGEPAHQESAFLSGNLISEVSAVFEGKELPEDPEPSVRQPGEVVGSFEPDTVVDMAVLEAIGEMDWDGVARTAGFMMLVPDRFLSLIQSFKEGTDVFRAEWNDLEESGRKPAWMEMGAFIALSKLSLDEGVVPRIVYWAGMALQAADEEVASYVAESYPELGQTVYGPAGDPKEGPRLAKAYMTPAPAGAMEPVKTDQTTRMFSDPADREKARKAKLDDVMSAIKTMRDAAAKAGVPPEGMFLNLYRDMHRERARFS